MQFYRRWFNFHISSQLELWSGLRLVKRMLQYTLSDYQTFEL